jgi:hypothetical protein
LNTTTDGIVKTTNGDGTLSIGAIALNELSDAFYNTSADNLVVGHNLVNNPSGTSNHAFSSHGLMNLTSGTYNNVFGSEALSNVTTGNGNTAMGHKTMQFLVDGAENTGFGQGALNSLTSGGNNTAVGVHAGSGNQTGRFNTSVGQEALNGTGNNKSNTAVGFQAGNGITTGSYNVFVGKKAGNTIEGGSSNVVIGDDADVSATSSNQIVIGKGAIGVGDNIAVIGNTSTQKVYMSEDAGAVVYTAGITTSVGAALTLNGAAGITMTTGTNGAISIDPNGTGNLTLGSADNTITSLSGNVINIDAAGALTLDGGAASNITTSAGALTLDGAAGVNITSTLDVTATLAGSSGVETGVEILPTINQTSTAGYTGLKLNVTETAVGFGEKKLIDLQVDGISKFSVNNLGAIDVTDAATTRNNLGIYSGKLDWTNIAPAGTNIETFTGITGVTTSSVIIVTKNEGDTTSGFIEYAICSSDGSITIKCTGVLDAGTKISYFIIN